MMHAFLAEAQTAPAAALPDISKRLYRAFNDGHLLEVELEAIGAILESRQAAARPPASQAIPLGRLRVFPKRVLQRSPDRSASIERRRLLAASGPLPPALAARFTTGELAVLRVVADEARDRGQCELCIDAIAAKAGVSRRLAQGAIRLAEGDGLVTVEERRRPGQRNETNVLRVLSREWRAWIDRGRRSGCRKLRTTDTNDTTPPGNRAATRPEEALRGGAGGPVTPHPLLDRLRKPTTGREVPCGTPGAA